MNTLCGPRLIPTLVLVVSSFVATPNLGAHMRGGFSANAVRSHSINASPERSRGLIRRNLAHGNFRSNRFVGRNRFLFRHHHHLLFVFDFAAFGLPWWYSDYYWDPTYYPFYEPDYAYGQTRDETYWTSLAVAVQSALTKRGYYHGLVDGKVGTDSRDAIHKFQGAQHLPVTGIIDPKLLKALGVSYRTA